MDVLDCDNKITCENCEKKIQIKRMCCFRTLPQYLTFQLKRFNYNFNMNAIVKYNGHFEFSREISMKCYTEQFEFGTEEQKAALSDGDFSYSLKAIVIHSGNANIGHYVSYIKAFNSNNEPQWYCFDDERVSPIDLGNDSCLGEACFGNDDRSRGRNAYILIYEKINNAKEGPLSPKDPPSAMDSKQNCLFDDENLPLDKVLRNLEIFEKFKNSAYMQKFYKRIIEILAERSKECAQKNLSCADNTNDENITTRTKSTKTFRDKTFNLSTVYKCLFDFFKVVVETGPNASVCQKILQSLSLLEESESKENLSMYADEMFSTKESVNLIIDHDMNNSHDMIPRCIFFLFKKMCNFLKYFLNDTQCHSCNLFVSLGILKFLG